jgi:hypothetical protein
MQSTYDLIAFIIVGAAVVVYSYAAFSAFSIRRRLSGNLYRRQALGIGLVTILFGSFAIGLTLDKVVVLNFVLGFVFIYAIFLATFYWIDTSIRAARFSDPLLRDTFHWSKLRFVMWGYIIAALAFVSPIAIDPSIYPKTPTVIGNIIHFGVVFAPVLTTLICGFAVFPVVARRSEDIHLRKQFEWFSAYVFVIFVLFLLGNVPDTEFAWFTSGAGYYLLQGITLAIAGYFLYRSARSLVPIYSFDPKRTMPGVRG